MEQEKFEFQKFTYVADDDDDFEIGELENFNLDLIAPKQESKIKVSLDEFSDDALLCKDDAGKDKIEEISLKSIYDLFEN